MGRINIYVKLYSTLTVLRIYTPSDKSMQSVVPSYLAVESERSVGRAGGSLFLSYRSLSVLSAYLAAGQAKPNFATARLYTSCRLLSVRDFESVMLGGLDCWAGKGEFSSSSSSSCLLHA